MRVTTAYTRIFFNNLISIEYIGPQVKTSENVDCASKSYTITSK